MNLTRSQISAINHGNSNLQLIACAGSGKTEVIARRVASLLKNGCRPNNIVAFTFTEKAAAELKERILSRCKEELGQIHGMAELYVGTIHAFCLDLLTAEVPKYLKFDVLNEVQQGLFIDRHSNQSGLTASTDLAGQPLKRYKDTPHYLSAISILREEAELNEAVLKNCSVLTGLESYRGLLDEKRHFDYSGIMEAAVEALTLDAAMKERLGQRIRHVIVDEYQDVNPIQEAIVWLLHELGAKICVVGDDDQTIYQWRGSSVQGILNFAKRYKKVTPVKLEENFRSSKGIVETARPFIEQNGERLQKKMRPTDAQDFEEGDIVALSFAGPEEEATYIAQTLQSMRGLAIKDPTKEKPNHRRGISWSDMAILLRSVRANGEPITRALDTAKIPYVIAGMNNLFGTPEAEASRQFFYFMANRPIDAVTLEAVWLSTGMGLNASAVRSAIQKAQALRDEFNASDLRNVRYGLQRVFLSFLEDCQIREERVANGRGEIVFYNLGKFTQVIADFETINYHSRPVSLYDGFANFLQFQAEDAYPEGWQDNQYANPDAVRIMTVHQAKGMQWPVVFVPALLKNRFPSMRHGGRSVWHLIPRNGVKDQARYEGTIEDERRLFYVAMTRSQKFLHMTWAPVTGNKLFQTRSAFWDDVLASKFVKRRPQDYSKRKHFTPAPKQGVANVVFSFSDLKYFFECPYQFKLRVLYGFNPPIREELGFGRSLHNALAEVHARAIRGDYATQDDVSSLIETHLHAPFANPALKQRMEAAAEKIVSNYIEDNKKDFDKIEFSEKQIDIPLGDGVSVVGRIDLVRRKDTNETTIVDLKSNDRAQAEDVTEHQLHIYALGYEELTGKRADFVEIYELDERKRKPRSVDNDFIEDVKDKVGVAAQSLRQNAMPPHASAATCAKCDYVGMCSAGKQAVQP